MCLDSFHGGVHVGDPHIRNTVNIDFRIQHHALKIFVQIISESNW